MIPSKNNACSSKLTERSRAGFTLIEAVVSIAIIGIVMTPLMITQGSVLQAVVKYSNKLQRMYYAENFFIDARIEASDEHKFTLEKKLDAPAMRLSYQREPVDKKSSLKDLDNVVRERITIEWDENGKKRQDVVVNFLYVAQQKVKKV
ncbi:MAG: type II secretion system protein [Candidatus Dependentiae bacterium]|nr:type II secretion system protein [Candidatus Dependentiae bacterium]